MKVKLKGLSSVEYRTQSLS
ncbi:hypothetical protein [Streptococcus devriesei]